MNILSIFKEVIYLMEEADKCLPQKYERLPRDLRLWSLIEFKILNVYYLIFFFNSVFLVFNF